MLPTHAGFDRKQLVIVDQKIREALRESLRLSAFDNRGSVSGHLRTALEVIRQALLVRKGQDAGEEVPNKRRHKKGRRMRKGRKISSRHCSKCGKVGHNTRTCEKPPHEVHFCSKCGKPGHNRRKCPAPIKPQ